MVRRQAEGEGAMAENLSAAPVTRAESGIAHRAAAAKSRTKALARRLRKSGRMASLTADISEGVENIAEFSDRIMELFEQARNAADLVVGEIHERVRRISELSVEAKKATVFSEENAFAMEELIDGFRQNSDDIRHLITAIQNAAGRHSEILKAAQELYQKSADIDSISSRLAEMLERADLAGLNAALEAGKAGESGAGFAVIAAMAQKMYSRLDRRAEDFLGIISQIKTGHEKLVAQADKAAERLRAIVVMTKGVRNALDDASGVVDELLDLTGGTASEIHRLSESLDAASPALDDLPGNVEHTLGAIDMAAGRIEEQEKSFADAAGNAERLLSSTTRLASMEDLAAALDDIYGASDSFIRSLGATLERLDLTLEAILAAARDMEILKRGVGADHEAFENIVRAADATRAGAQTFRDRTNELRKNLENALSVLRDVSRELGFLREEEGGVTDEIDGLNSLYTGIPRFAGQAGSFSGVMASLSVSGGVETVRAGEAAAGFTALTGEFETIASESADLEDAISDLAVLFDGRIMVMSRKQGCLDWRALADAFENSIRNLQDIVESRIGGVLAKGESLAAMLAEHGRGIAEVVDKAGDALAAAEGAVKATNEAVGIGEEQKNVFRRTLGLAEKITTLADEIYPEDEIQISASVR